MARSGSGNGSGNGSDHNSDSDSDSVRGRERGRGRGRECEQGLGLGSNTTFSSVEMVCARSGDAHTNDEQHSIFDHDHNHDHNGEGEGRHARAKKLKKSRKKKRKRRKNHRRHSEEEDDDDDDDEEEEEEATTQQKVRSRPSQSVFDMVMRGKQRRENRRSRRERNSIAHKKKQELRQQWKERKKRREMFVTLSPKEKVNMLWEESMRNLHIPQSLIKKVDRGVKLKLAALCVTAVMLAGVFLISFMMKHAAQSQLRTQALPLINATVHGAAQQFQYTMVCMISLLLHPATRPDFLCFFPFEHGAFQEESEMSMRLMQRVWTSGRLNITSDQTTLPDLAREYFVGNAEIFGINALYVLTADTNDANVHLNTSRFTLKLAVRKGISLGMPNHPTKVYIHENSDPGLYAWNATMRQRGDIVKNDISVAKASLPMREALNKTMQSKSSDVDTEQVWVSEMYDDGLYAGNTKQRVLSVIAAVRNLQDNRLVGYLVIEVSLTLLKDRLVTKIMNPIITTKRFDASDVSEGSLIPHIDIADISGKTLLATTDASVSDVHAALKKVTESEEDGGGGRKKGRHEESKDGEVLHVTIAFLGMLYPIQCTARFPEQFFFAWEYEALVFTISMGILLLFVILGPLYGLYSGSLNIICHLSCFQWCKREDENKNDLVIIREDNTPGPKHSMANADHSSSMALSLSDIVVEEEVVEHLNVTKLVISSLSVIVMLILITTWSSYAGDSLRTSYTLVSMIISSQLTEAAVYEMHKASAMVSYSALAFKTSVLKVSENSDAFFGGGLAITGAFSNEYLYYGNDEGRFGGAFSYALNSPDIPPGYTVVTGRENRPSLGIGIGAKDDFTFDSVLNRTVYMKMKINATASGLEVLEPSLSRFARNPSTIFARDLSEAALIRKVNTYDPRLRPWYTAGNTTDAGASTHWTEPYIFASSLELGITVTRRIRFEENGVKRTIVFAGDISLQGMSKHLRELSAAVINQNRQQLPTFVPIFAIGQLDPSHFLLARSDASITRYNSVGQCKQNTIAFRDASGVLGDVGKRVRDIDLSDAAGFDKNIWTESDYGEVSVVTRPIMDIKGLPLFSCVIFPTVLYKLQFELMNREIIMVSMLLVGLQIYILSLISSEREKEHKSKRVHVATVTSHRYLKALLRELKPRVHKATKILQAHKKGEESSALEATQETSNESDDVHLDRQTSVRRTRSNSGSRSFASREECARALNYILSTRKGDLTVQDVIDIEVSRDWFRLKVLHFRRNGWYNWWLSLTCFIHIFTVFLEAPSLDLPNFSLSMILPVSGLCLLVYSLDAVSKMYASSLFSTKRKFDLIKHSREIVLLVMIVDWFIQMTTQYHSRYSKHYHRYCYVPYSAPLRGLYAALRFRSIQRVCNSFFGTLVYARDVFIFFTFILIFIATVSLLGMSGLLQESDADAFILTGEHFNNFLSSLYQTLIFVLTGENYQSVFYSAMGYVLKDSIHDEGSGVGPLRKYMVVMWLLFISFFGTVVISALVIGAYQNKYSEAYRAFTVQKTKNRAMGIIAAFIVIDVDGTDELSQSEITSFCDWGVKFDFDDDDHLDVSEFYELVEQMLFKIGKNKLKKHANALQGLIRNFSQIFDRNDQKTESADGEELSFIDSIIFRNRAVLRMYFTYESGKLHKNLMLLVFGIHLWCVSLYGIVVSPKGSPIRDSINSWFDFTTKDIDIICIGHLFQLF